MGGCCATNAETGFKSLSMNPPTANMTSDNRLKLSPDTFIPKKKIWIIVKNKDYSTARKNQSLKALRDISDADEKVQAVLQGIKCLGAKQNDITVLENAKR